MISPCGHDRCVHKGHHSCLPTLRPDGSGMTLTERAQRGRFQNEQIESAGENLRAFGSSEYPNLGSQSPILDRLLAILTTRQPSRSEEHTSELQSRLHLVCRLLLEKKKR